MPIYDQTFRRYEGPRKTTALWLPIARQTMRPVLKSKLSWLGFGVVLLSVLFLSIGFFAASRAEQIVPGGQANAAMEGAVSQGLPIFGGNITLNTILFYFLMQSLGVMWFLIVVGGGASVSLDRSHNALPLYFSRPLGVRDYMLGKIAGLAAIPALIYAVSVLLVYLQAIAYFRPPSELIAQLPTLLTALLFIAISSVVMALVMAAFSSCTKSSRTAIVCFVGFWIASQPVAFILYGTTRNAKTAGVSLGLSLRILLRHLLNPDIKRLPRIAEFWDPGMATALISVACYSVFFIWLLRRNLKVVEVVK